MAARGMVVELGESTSKVSRGEQVVMEALKVGNVYKIDAVPYAAMMVDNSPHQSGAGYVLVFVDNFSRHVAAYFIKKKSEVPQRFADYKALMETRTGARMKKVRTGNETEFVNKAFNGICTKSGVVHQLTVPYSPQQNGLVERINRTVVEKARAMMHYKKVECKWWAKAVNTAAYLVNRSPNAVRTNKTPHEVVFGEVPRLNHLCVFGSLGFAHIEAASRNKMDSKAYKCMVVGYADAAKAYRVVDISTGKAKHSRSIVVDERDVDGIYAEFDVDTAFLYAPLKEAVYIAVPDGVDAPESTVLKLRKSLYGLRQASREWNNMFDSALKDIGFSPATADPCVYIARGERGFVYLCLYVDDLLVGASTVADADAVRQRLLPKFRLKDLGIARFVLGVEVSKQHERRLVTMKQSRYIGDVRFEMKTKPYRSLIGCLLYISACTRPDMSYAVGSLSRYVENPGRAHWKAAIHVLRYLYHTRDLALRFKGQGDKIKLRAYCDSDWAANRDDRRSVSGVVGFAAGDPIIFKSRTQSTVALSTSEAEMVAASLASQEIKWARQLLKDMMIEQQDATVLMCDNQGAVAMANHVGPSQRAKHMDTGARFVQEAV
ncbi:hypothetical protein PybrP1_000200 [[Pythium] brassicae (nom. inval.)]|nr:hypothetical protein PybrP1_000200 [[Pythium] brassicae (nom. inval.)]